ncbi:hypothetical protein EV182_002915 [Spiromyces aspiralis]|uniref:Uncharacterized protein n=1 Tax=Spiromyces aspiralis TaxID=68401 RepID=A0ACC1HTC1_9FUNG|nr:hypothetical protein EV182_002915 [Spiromyces aspiralis]
MTYHSIGVLYTALDIVRTMYYDCRSLSVSRPLHSSRDRMQQYLESMYRKCVEMFDGKLHPWMIKANGKSPGHAYLSPRFPKKKSGVRPAPPEAFAELFLVTDPALLDTSLSLVYMSLHRTLFTKIEIDHAITWARQAYIPLLLHCLRQPGYSPCGMPFMAASETSPAAEFAWNTEERGVMLAIIDLTSVVAFGRDPSDLVFATPPSLMSHERPPSLQETSGALQLDEMDDGTSLPIQVITAARVVAEIVYALTHFLLHECGDAASHEAIGVPSMDCQSVALTYLNTVLTFIVDPEGAERDRAQETPQKLRGKGKTPTLEPLVQKTRRYLRHLLLQWEGCMELLAKLCTVYASRDGDIPVTYEGIPSADLLPEDFGLRGVSYIRLSPAVRDPGPGGMPPIPTKDALVAARKRRFVRLALWFTDHSSILTSRSEASPPAIRGTKAAPEVAVEHGEIDQRPRPRSTSILADKLAATDEVADPDAEVRALAQRRSEGGGEEGDNVAGEYDNASSLSESCDAEIQALKVQRETLQTLLDSQATNLRTKKRDRGIKKGPDRRQILRQIMADVDRRATVVVFDTNCFIDHLGVIKQTAEEDGWTLLVPLAIVMELEGLKRSGPPKRCSAAAKALGYIERGISAESDGGDEDPTDLPWTQARIKVVTAGGDVHHDLKFRSECYDFSGETSGYFSIDDVIIDACVRYGARQATKAGGGGKEGKEATPVVLVSLDRNLRIKSSTRNLTCLDLKQWRACAKSKR